MLSRIICLFVCGKLQIEIKLVKKELYWVLLI